MRNTRIRALAVFPLIAIAMALNAARAQTRNTAPSLPKSTYYWVYVASEAADVIHRIRFGPDGATIEKTIAAGEFASDIEGPHGLQISKDARWLFVTTAHGQPDGKYWKYAIGPDTLVGRSTFLGFFPSTIDVTPDGLFAFIANFNLHGDMVPSSISVVYTPNNTEVARTVTCTMPHGSRLSPDGSRHYSVCMMDEQLVEIDGRSFAVARRFSLRNGHEGPIDISASVMDTMTHARPANPDSRLNGAIAPFPTPKVGEAGLRPMPPRGCAPTWAQPSIDSRKVYVACSASNEIIEVDVATWTLGRRLRTGVGPYNLAATPDGRFLVATLKAEGALEIFDAGSGKSLARLRTSAVLASGVAISTDSHYAFVTSEGRGSSAGAVDVFDLETRARIASVKTEPQAGGIAFWRSSPNKQ